jgi:nucleoside-diphosphate-sugar epimerase
MRVFVTGATGFIGSALVPELIGAGHEVVGLTRTEEGAEALRAWGATPRQGSLADPAGLAEAAGESDGVIHLAYIHEWRDYNDMLAASGVDLAAVEAMAQAMEGSGKALIIASGTLMVAHARPATEADMPLSLDTPRCAAAARTLAAPGVRGVVVRLSPSVHDRARQGLVTQLIALAREKGVSPYVGEGAARWPAVHRRDAARLLSLALDKAQPGTALHAVAEEVTLRDIAEAIGKGLGLPSPSLSPAEAGAHFGMFAGFVGMDNPTSSAVTRETLGWTPREAGLVAGLTTGGYLTV